MTKIVINLAESTSAAKISTTGVRVYLQGKLAQKLITARELQRVVDWMKENPMQFQQQSRMAQTEAVMALRLFKRIIGKDVPRPEKKKDAE
ncbi:hypothetical protein pEaSNUABM13_00182 [Erwinia phage pEa_SNUABM_13]|nr:hypothetical protein pEaSNUABM13_00182 [Erwinia phage pEa_SNUABM_13]QYW03482.1 hypothetical protein pEaSNUABM34_00180 [Erwinia phage pEa_SNUABM_34]QYW05195.1 hypothetical protein pEaSNUABM21_00181 [Erwinia phage pEa_SNUABM_21]QYW05537.1 hypothetical protein pEaSNUABM25_00181 [Erwinia phage pEa_SNUABM_25]